MGAREDSYSRDSSPLKELSAAFREIDARNSALIKQIETEKAKLTLVITEATREQMPQTNYTIKTDEVHLSGLAHKVIYSDEVKITNNHTKEVIAYDRSVMQLYSAVFMPSFSGPSYYYSHPLCGKGSQLFERWVFIGLGNRGTNHKIGLNEKLYYKFTTKGTK